MHVLALLAKSPFLRGFFMLTIMAILLLMLAFQRQKQHILQAETALQLQEITELRQVAARYTQNQQKLAALNQQLQRLNQHTLQQSYQLEQLKNDNQALRDWANTRLPADVIRLYSRPARPAPCVSGRLPAADSLPSPANCAD